jgi:hypothetical protein
MCIRCRTSMYKYSRKQTVNVRQKYEDKRLLVSEFQVNNFSSLFYKVSRLSHDCEELNYISSDRWAKNFSRTNLPDFSCR